MASLLKASLICYRSVHQCLNYNQKFFSRFSVNKQIRFQGIDIFQGQASTIIIKNEQLFGLAQGFIKGILHHIKQGLVFLHNGFKGVSGILYRPKVQPEICCNPFQQIGRFQPFFRDRVFIFRYRNWS